MALNTSGVVVHWAARYDLLVWLLTFGKERKFREMLLDPARLQPGESVLDVGCGTGTIAIAAKRRVGPTGAVCGIDPSSAMIARARRKATHARLDVTFDEGIAESLPYEGGRFDVVLSTVMLHHLPRAARPQAAGEMRRVLKPGGRVLLVDFGGAAQRGESLIARLHRGSRPDPRALEALLTDAGLRITETTTLKTWALQSVLAEAPR